MHMIKLAVSGACGRMGSRIISLAKLERDLCVVLALEQDGHPKLNSRIESVTVTSDDSLLSKVDCLIEFSEPAASLRLLKKCLTYQRPIVIGTTGFDESQIQAITDAAVSIPVLLSPNMSVGVNLLLRLLKEMAKVLDNYQTKIIEAHHIHKKDSPSGTAKKIAQVIEAASGRKVTNIQSIREGEVIGEHEVIFDGEFDRISLKHAAKSRDIFAGGALIAARWLITKQHGFYTMGDCLQSLLRKE